MEKLTNKTTAFFGKTGWIGNMKGESTFVDLFLDGECRPICDCKLNFIGQPISFLYILTLTLVLA